MQKKGIGLLRSLSPSVWLQLDMFLIYNVDLIAANQTYYKANFSKNVFEIYPSEKQTVKFSSKTLDYLTLLNEYFLIFRPK